MACTGCLSSLTQFLSMLNDETRLKEFLRLHRVIDGVDVMSCPKCNNACEYNPSSFKFMCSNTVAVPNERKRKRCDFVKYVKKNTFFSDTEKSMQEICIFVSYWLINTTQEDLEGETGWSSHEVFNWSMICREILLAHFSKNNERLGGPGKMIKIDESNFISEESFRCRLIKSKCFFGGIEKNSKRVFFVPVVNLSKDTLLELIRNWVLPGTTIVSDCFGVYNCLSDDDFQQLSVSHSFKFIDSSKEGHSHERYWKNIYETVLKGGSRDKYFVFHLAEFQFKRFTTWKEMFHDFFKYVAEAYHKNAPTLSDE